MSHIHELVCRSNCNPSILLNSCTQSRSQANLRLPSPWAGSSKPTKEVYIALQQSLPCSRQVPPQAFLIGLLHLISPGNETSICTKTMLDSKCSLGDFHLGITHFPSPSRTSSDEGQLPRHCLIATNTAPLAYEDLKQYHSIVVSFQPWIYASPTGEAQSNVALISFGRLMKTEDGKGSSKV